MGGRNTSRGAPGTPLETEQHKICMSVGRVTITVSRSVLPCSLEGVYECFRQTCFLHTQGRTEAGGSSEMLVRIYQTAPCHISEDRNCAVYEAQ